MKKRKKSYRVVVARGLFFFLIVLVVSFLGYLYADYREETQITAIQEATNQVNRIVQQNDDRLGNLKQFYLTNVNESEIKWILENDISYSDYSHYKDAFDVLSGDNLFGDYIKEFTFVNFRTKWIISNRGMFQLENAYNGEVLSDIFEQVSDLRDQNNWLYATGIVIENSVDRRYRVTIETDGLNLVMRLPANSLHTDSMLIVNVNMEEWKRWTSQWLDSYQSVVVLDADGNLVYGNASQAEVCRLLSETGDTTGIRKFGKNQYGIATAQSEILGWRYYVLHDVEMGKHGMRLSVWVLLVIALLIGFAFVGVSYMIYHPVQNLVRDVSEAGGDANGLVSGNELEYLAGSFLSLKQGQVVMEELLHQQRDRLTELFQLRLIHGEVDADEWEEYLEDLNLTAYPYFATVVIVLDLKEEVQSSVNEDALCLKLLQQLPTDLRIMTWMPPIYNAGTIFGIFAETDEDLMLEKIKRYHASIQNYTEQIAGYRVLMGVSATHTSHSHIRAAYRESINALTHSMVEEGDAEKQETCRFYLTSSTMKEKEFERQYENQIQEGIKAVDKQMCYHVADNFSLFLKNGKLPGDQVSIYLLRFVDAIMLTAIDAGISLDVVYPDGVKKYYRELMEVTELDRERRFIKRYFIDPIIKARVEYLETHANSILEEITRLIEEKSGNISLSECSEILGVSQNYIWKVLKMERDKSFLDLIEEYKLKEAKHLLLHTSMPVAEIAEKLNYTNAQNFIRFFSKNVGMTPGKFRKFI